MVSNPGSRVRIALDCRKGVDDTDDSRSLVKSHTGSIVPLADGLFGTLEGDFVFGDVTSTEPTERLDFHTNPRIRLDNGDIIWGAECWWEYVEDGLPTLEESRDNIRKYVNTLVDYITIATDEILSLEDGEDHGQ